MSSRRWFVDENNLLLARRLAEVRDGVVHPGHADLPEVPRGASDETWLEVVGAIDLIVITRDKRIRYRPVERQRWIDHAVRGFVLTSAGNMRIDDQLAILGSRWAAMESIEAANPRGPWMYSVTRSGIRQLISRPRERDAFHPGAGNGSECGAANPMAHLQATTDGLVAAGR